MLDLEGIYQNESVEDVLLYFALRTSYPWIDRMYVRYKFEVAAERELLFTCQRLVKEGKLMETKKLFMEKGPNWKEPKFVTDKKYGIE
ncbi:MULTISPECIES: immunity protein [Erwiniaceae]|uniref:Immunity protein n=2 Tax=Erwiniaceae TaxID=1903409 RepID=A0ACC5RI92_ENTAG|nr:MULTISPECIES: immunity protein [Erwiniaceae]MBK4724328.1 immunity protein [Pantoea agglomerans]MCS3606938.1 hypothetical protein [Erwinia rhapontici]NKG30583.1 immunity protein [Erwinia rhapontici]TDS99171.1 hypothetical protein EDF84_10414 [Erwinia rhapontici]UDQ81043.1 immunity protein [Erwinia rhapontici]